MSKNEIVPMRSWVINVTSSANKANSVGSILREISDIMRNNFWSVIELNLFRIRLRICG